MPLLKSAKDVATFRLLDLPPELRNAVYEQVLSVGIIRIPCEPEAARNVRPPALLQVSRQIRKESSPTYYATNTFCLCITHGNARCAIKWLQVFARAPFAGVPPPIELSPHCAAPLTKALFQPLPESTVSRLSIEVDRELEDSESRTELIDLGNVLRKAGYHGQSAIEFCPSTDWVKRTKWAFSDDNQSYQLIMQEILSEVRDTATILMGEGEWAVMPNTVEERRSRSSGNTSDIRLLC